MFSILVLNSEHIANCSSKIHQNGYQSEQETLTAGKSWPRMDWSFCPHFPLFMWITMNASHQRWSVFLLYSFHLLSPLANSVVFPFSVANLDLNNCSSELISECITSMKLTIHHYVPSYVTSFLIFPTTIYFITSFPFTLVLPNDGAHLCEVWLAFWSWKVNFLG